MCGFGFVGQCLQFANGVDAADIGIGYLSDFGEHSRQAIAGDTCDAQQREFIKRGGRGAAFGIGQNCVDRVEEVLDFARFVNTGACGGLCVDSTVEQLECAGVAELSDACSG